MKTSSTVLTRNRCHLIASPNEQFDNDENNNLNSLPDVSNNDSVTIPTSESTLQPTHDGNVYTHSGWASRPPKHYNPDYS